MLQEIIDKGLEMLWEVVMNKDNECSLLIVNRSALGYSDILSRMGIIQTIEMTNKLSERMKSK